MLAEPPLPTCPKCSSLLRPNILMFGDAGWDESRSWEQEQRFNRWLHDITGARLVIVECGAGTAIPTVRHLCEHVAAKMQATLIRLNVREPQVPNGHIGLATGALAGLQAIDEQIAR
jgi:NAD-dependent SIR2 family protein deacetylase